MSRTADKRRQATRAKIVEAARRLFGQLGYHNTQVMDIVHAVGMSAGTFYNHFKDKQDLFEQLTTENVENLRQKLRSLRDSFNILDETERRRGLRDSFEEFFDHVDENPQQMLMLLRGHPGTEPRLDAWSYSLSVGRDLVEDAERWAEQGLAANHEPMFFAHAVVGMSMQVVQSYLVEQKFSREETIEALVAMTTAMFNVCFQVGGGEP